jgi:hypothetical protein
MEQARRGNPQWVTVYSGPKIRRRRGVRAAEGTRLEIAYTGNRIRGSNPLPSAYQPRAHQGFGAVVFGTLPLPGAGRPRRMMQNSTGVWCCGGRFAGRVRQRPRKSRGRLNTCYCGAIPLISLLVKRVTSPSRSRCQSLQRPGRSSSPCSRRLSLRHVPR